MDYQATMILLRLLHIVFGVVLVGNSVFLAFFLEPKLKALGPGVQGPVMKAVMPLVAPVQLVSALVVIATGTGMVLRMRWTSLGTFFSTGWGWAIFLGFLVTVAGTVVGSGMLGPTARRMEQLGEGIQGRPPTPEEMRRLEALSSKVARLSRVAATLAIAAVVAMAVARFV